MADKFKLEWNAVGEKKYETGVKNGVLYVFDQVSDSNKAGYGAGVVWNGLTQVNETPSGAEKTSLWADDGKYINLVSAEEFGCTIECYAYPDEFMECDGSATVSGIAGMIAGQQDRKTFGFSYVTTMGNDTKSNQYGEKLHIVYGCLAAPSEKSYSTVNDSPEAVTFSYDISTTPINVSGLKPTSLITIDSTKVGAAAYKAVQEALYGTESTDAKLPTPDEIAAIIAAKTNVG